jgi:hypothetical protein
VESDLIDIEKANPGFHLTIVRPAGIVGNPSAVAKAFDLFGLQVGLQDVILDAAVSGQGGECLENAEIVEKASKLKS